MLVAEGRADGDHLLPDQEVAVALDRDRAVGALALDPQQRQVPLAVDAEHRRGVAVAAEVAAEDDLDLDAPGDHAGVLRRGDVGVGDHQAGRVDDDAGALAELAPGRLLAEDAEAVDGAEDVQADHRRASGLVDAGLDRQAVAVTGQQVLVAGQLGGGAEERGEEPGHRHHPQDTRCGRRGIASSPSGP